MLHQLDTDDIRILDEVLSQQLRTLLNEIAHADDRAFRRSLLDRYERIESIRHHLVASAPEVLQPETEREDDIELDSSFH